MDKDELDKEVEEMEDEVDKGVEEEVDKEMEGKRNELGRLSVRIDSSLPRHLCHRIHKNLKVRSC